MDSPFRFVRRPKRPGLRRPVRPALERLEGRDVPSTFTVTNLNDAGAGSLRQVILEANNNREADAIVFQAGLSGTLTLTTGQLNVTAPVTITGPGSAKLIISGNNASRLFLVNNGSPVVENFGISGLTLTQGKATGTEEGGGIDVGSENLVLKDVVITNSTALRGGGIHVGANGRLTMENSSVTACVTTSIEGGGLYLDMNSTTLLRNSNVAGNQAVGPSGTGGGGIRLVGGFLAVESSIISGNTTPLSGGGILGAGTLVVRNSTISANEGGSGGGILMEGSLTIENSTISTNKARFDGGGVWVTKSTAAIRNSTIVFNTADSDNNGNGTQRGGGLFLFENGAPTNSVALQSTIVAENKRGTAGPREDVVGTVSGTNNLIGVDTGLVGLTIGLNINQIGTAAAPIDPMLGPLGFNGGTALTHALLAGSPAINAGFNFSGSAADQRGGAFSRAVGLTDIGAFEVQPPPQPAPKPGPQADPKPLPQPSLPDVAVTMKRVGRRTRVDVMVDGALRRRFFPFGAFTGRVQLSQVDVNGDGMLDVVARATINGKKRTRTFTT
jgi:hypothetical protein